MLHQPDYHLSCLVKETKHRFFASVLHTTLLRFYMNSPGTDSNAIERIAAARQEAEILKEKLKRRQDALNDGQCELTSVNGSYGLLTKDF